MHSSPPALASPPSFELRPSCTACEPSCPLVRKVRKDVLVHPPKVNEVSSRESKQRRSCVPANFVVKQPAWHSMTNRFSKNFLHVCLRNLVCAILKKAHKLELVWRCMVTRMTTKWQCTNKSVKFWSCVGTPNYIATCLCYSLLVSRCYAIRHKEKKKCSTRLPAWWKQTKSQKFISIQSLSSNTACPADRPPAVIPCILKAKGAVSPATSEALGIV